MKTIAAAVDSWASNRLDIFGIEGGDEGLAQASEEIVNDAIALLFYAAHLGFDSADAVVAVVEAAQEELRGAAQDLGMAFEEEKELFVLR